MSQAITYSEARQNLAETMNRVCDHHEPVIITRQKSPSVVMMSLEDYNSIMETAYLLRSPANAARLREAIQARPFRMNWRIDHAAYVDAACTAMNRLSSSTRACTSKGVSGVAVSSDQLLISV